MQLDKDVATGRWKLSGALCIEDANSLREALLGCFADPGGVILDVGAVSECDTTGLQLLIAAQRTAASQGRDFCIEQPADDGGRRGQPAGKTGSRHSQNGGTGARNFSCQQ